MTVGLDVAVSAQAALERRLATVAHNIANATTAGFRAEEVRFADIVSARTDRPVHFVSPGDTHLSRRTGALVATHNPLDVAVRGDAWLAVATPAGTAYTRDGRLTMQPTGELTSLVGHPVLDPGGAPLTLDPGAGPPAIAVTGVISQAGRVVGGLGLYRLPAGAPLARYGDTAVMTAAEAEPVLEPAEASLHQGLVEQSNVDAAGEMMRLILISRTFEAVSATLAQMQRGYDDAVRDLGGG